MTDTAAPPLPKDLKIRLSVMMFLQYAIWGAWLPFLWSYMSDVLQFSDAEKGQIFAIGAVGAILGPALAGPIADRFVSTERLLALSHLIGAALIWQLSTLTSYEGYFYVSLAYGFVYMPTLSLTNSLSFAHLPDRDRDFGKVRLWGTFGWIVVGLTMGQWLYRMHSPEGMTGSALELEQVKGKVDAFKLSAVLGFAMALYCLTLPHTPPAGKKGASGGPSGASSNPVLSVLGEVRHQPLLTLFLVAVPISCIHQFYFVHADGFLTHKNVSAPGWMNAIFGAGGGGLMTIGQMSEVLVLGMIPLVAKTLSRKSLLLVGLLAYAGRMALFGYVDAIPLPTSLVLILGIALHGLCFGCFIFVAYMVVDEQTSHASRASAQNLFNLVIVGIGTIVGSMVAGSVAKWATVTDAATGDSAMDYTRLFSVPMYAALIVFVVMLVIYPSRAEKHGDVEFA